MRPKIFSRNAAALFALTLLFASPAAADVRFRVRQMTRNDVPPGKGQCDIRLQVDDQVEVAVHGDSVNLHRLSGQEPRDDGSECNFPLPDRGELRDFRFEVIDSRNEIRLVEEPSRRNDFTARVSIRDSSGGFGRYHFRLSWAAVPRDRRDDDFPRRDDDHDRGPGPGGFVWNNVMHFASPGRGGSTLSGYGSQRLFDASVDIDRGGRIQVTFRTDSGRSISFSGTVLARDGDVLKADVVADERMLRLRGPMYLTLRGREDIEHIAIETTNGRDNLRLNWDRR